MRRAVFARILCLGLFAASQTACVHVEKEPVVKAHLFVTRSHAETRLTWKSQKDVSYTVMAQPKRGGSTWEPLAGAVNLRGTGDELSVVDHPDRGVVKRYRLHIVPLKPLKK